MMTLSDFREPLWLLLAFTPMLLILISSVFRLTQQQHYAEPEFLPWVIVQARQDSSWHVVRLLLIQLAWIMFAIAASGPRTAVKAHDLVEQDYREVIAIVDTSLSMSARDTLPSRIERSKLELLDLVETMQNTRLAIVVYAARPHLLNPLTSDKAVLRHYISTIHSRMLPTEGSRPFVALDFAQQFFSSSDQRARSIILISDGEHHLDADSFIQASQKLSKHIKQAGVYLYSLGVGTETGSQIIAGENAWLEENHQAVLSQLNRGFMQQIADLGAGVYSDVTDDNSDWKAIYHNGIARLDHRAAESSSEEFILWNEEFSAYLIAGIFFLLLSSLTGIMLKPSKLLNKLPLPRRYIYSLLLVFSGTLFLIANSGFADDIALTDQQQSSYTTGMKHYHSGELEQARKLFSQLPGFNARFAEAVVSYELQDYKQAIPLFIQAVLDARDQPQRIDSIFNLANSYYKLGNYSQAEQLYKDVLRYAPSHTAATINLAYASKLKQQATQDASQSSTRQGRGPSLADIEQGQEITGRVALGDSDSDSNTSVGLNNESSTGSSSLLFTDSKLASEKIVKTDDTSWTYDITSLELLKTNQPVFNTNESVLWQRLFETEEGYDAPQQQPNIVPGVKPW